MFESALLELSTGSLHQSSLWTKGLSFGVEMFLLAIALLAPLLYTEALPKPSLSIIELPAPSAVPAPRSRSVVSRPTTHSELNDGRVILPARIPHQAHAIRDEPAADASALGDLNGVVGTPPTGRSANGVITALLNAVPATMPKSVVPHAVRVSSGVAAGLLIHEVRPSYPSLARSARVHGVVVLQATIGNDGSIQSLRLLSGHPFLTQAAMDAVRQWRYRPYLLNNQPVEVDTTIQVKFQLNGAD